MSTQRVLVCNEFATDQQGVTSCSAQTWVDSYVVTPEQASQIELLATGGFDAETFSYFFTATLVLFAIGFSVGIVISQLRKLR